MARLIDKDNLIKTIPNTDIDMFENCGRCTLLDKEEVIAIINKAPTIDAEPVRHGKWLYIEHKLSKDYSIAYYCCSECDFPTYSDQDKYYCPNCGAKMKGEEE